MKPSSLLLQKVIYLSLFLSIFALYWPGFSGSFMLDDLSTLPTLFQSIDACGFWCGITSGSAGPTGRPISLLSFALQIDQWPGAYSFKLLNVVIHLINALFVFLIFSNLMRDKYGNIRGGYIAIFAMFLWAIWPLQISSVLYVVQRMVLLSSLYVLVGLYIYVRFRTKFNIEWKGDIGKWGIFLCSIGTCGLFAIFAKESGVLLVIYIAVLEFIWFSKLGAYSKFEVAFRRYVLMLPIGGLITFLLYRVISQGELLYLAREYSLTERLLTESRILIEYLYSVFLPKASNLGLYHDAYLKSTSLVQPISTLYSLFFLVAMVIMGFKYRKKFPLFSVAVFWFLGGHLLESTVLPLELYFEHRNYLPIMMLTLLFVLLMCSLIMKASKSFVKWSFSTILFIYTLMICGLTFSQVSMWGNKLEYGVIQAAEHPNSVRARSLLVDVYNQLGQVDKGYTEMLRMQRDFPRVAGVIVGHIEFACYDSKYTLRPLSEVLPRLENAKFGYGAIVSIANATSDISEGKCQNVEPSYLLEIIHALRSNPLYIKKKTLLQGYEVSLLTLMGEYEKAVEVYSVMNVLQPEHWPRYISLLASLGRYKEAFSVTDEAIDALEYQSQYSIYLEDVLRLRSILKEDIENEFTNSKKKLN